MNRNGKRNINVQDLVKGAFLAALSIVLTRFLSFIYLETIRIGFGGIPIILSGLLFGPVVGGITGVAADLIGVLINPMGTPHLGFTLTSALEGIIPGILSIYFMKHYKNGRPFTFLRILLTVLLVVMGSSLILNTIWLSQLYGKGFMVLLPPRIISAAINVPIHSFLIYIIIKNLRKNSRN